MCRTIIINENTISLKKAVKKWSEITVNNEYLKGTIRIVNYRRYSYRSEVDVTFEGQIYVAINGRKSDWHDTSVLTKYNISKVKLNRFLRKKSFTEVQNRLNYYGITLRVYNNIKKIKWI